MLFEFWLIVPADELECHVCNGMHENQCNDPFGHYAETGDLRAPDTFVKKCEDPEVRKASGIPAGVKATMCRKIYQDGMYDIQQIKLWKNIKFFNKKSKMISFVNILMMQLF